jgi:hypothetical protein
MGALLFALSTVMCAQTPVVSKYMPKYMPNIEGMRGRTRIGGDAVVGGHMP